MFTIYARTSPYRGWIFVIQTKEQAHADIVVKGLLATNNWLNVVITDGPPPRPEPIPAAFIRVGG